MIKEECFMKLYEIKEDLEENLDLLTEVGEDNLAQENCQEMLDFLKEELKAKSGNILKYVRNLESEKLIIKEEIERLEKLKKGKESKVEFLKKYLIQTMLELDEKKIETDLGSYGIRAKSRVEILDMNSLPEEFVKTKIERTADKIKIGEYLKYNGELPGARMVQGYSLQIR
jgi:hypothetical protein